MRRAANLTCGNFSYLKKNKRRRFLLEMPTEYVEVLPDANGRALNNYPGLAGSHRLAFDGEAWMPGRGYKRDPRSAQGAAINIAPHLC